MAVEIILVSAIDGFIRKTATKAGFEEGVEEGAAGSRRATLSGFHPSHGEEDATMAVTRFD